MTQKTTDQVMAGKTYRQNLMNKLSIEAGQAHTCKPEGEKELYAQKLEQHIESLKAHLDDMAEKSQKMEIELRQAFEADKTTLNQQIEDLKIRLNKIRNSSELAWKEIGSGASNALKELIDGFKSAASKFK